MTRSARIRPALSQARGISVGFFVTARAIPTRVARGSAIKPADRADQRVVARTRAASSTHRPPFESTTAPTLPDDDFDESDDNQELGTVIPFGIFDARAEARRWP